MSSEIAVIIDQERRLFAAIRQAACKFESDQAVEQQRHQHVVNAEQIRHRLATEREQTRHSTFEQASRDDASKITNDALQTYGAIADAEAKVSSSFLARYGVAPAPNSVRPRPITGASGEEFARALAECARYARIQVFFIQQISFFLKCIAGGAFFLMVVLAGYGAGAAASFWTAAILGASASVALVIYGGRRAFPMLFEHARTAEAIVGRWGNSANLFASAQIRKSYDHLRSVCLQSSDQLQRTLTLLESQHLEKTNALMQAWRMFVESNFDAYRAVVVNSKKVAPAWSDSAWAHWEPSTIRPPAVRLGNYTGRFALPAGCQTNVIVTGRDGVSFSIDLCNLPALLPFPGERPLLLHAPERGREAAIQLMRSIATQLLARVPPGKVRFTFVDPIGLGDSFALFMDAKKHDAELVTHRVWTEPRQIEKQLEDLTQHIEDVIQMYLRSQYATIEHYNEKAGEIAEPYRVLMISDFPVNFSEEAARRLVGIATNGPRCGVFTVISVDTKKKLPHDFSVAGLERVCNVLSWTNDGFIWQDIDKESYDLELDSAADPKLVDHVIHEIGVRLKDAKKVQVPFDFVATPQEQWWTKEASNGIVISLGRAGATDQQRLDLGSGTALHALICGKTGSGKTTLLHVLVTNVALAYSPDEVELYLIDFKKGVEFKRYAAGELPHARVIAIETEREFGLSVLQGLDAELTRRGNLFRQAEVQNITAYRQKFPNERCPRILLIIDEFHEFFVDDDKVGHEASLVLDRLVRQGRAFGVHVILGTQTLAGTYSLARSTIEQIAIRIALQCSDADSRLILSDENSAARLLSRPGDAIYNNANGLVEGNQPFQVTWLADDESEAYLKRVRELATKRNWKPPRPQIVFEGNATSSVEKNLLLGTLLAARSWPALPKGVHAWIGEPIAIKDPTSAVFRRQAANNLIILGQDDEAALSILSAVGISLAAQHDPKHEGTRARFYVIDLSPPDRGLDGKLKAVFSKLPHQNVFGGRRDVEKVIREIGQEVKVRLDGADAAAKEAIYLIINGLHRARDLRPDDGGSYYNDDGGDGEPVVSLSDSFQSILREGPELGVHTLAWCDNWNNLDRILVRGLLREFGMRVAFQMSADDSNNFLDTPLASKLGRRYALFMTDEEGRIEKFRPYGFCNVWIESVQRQLRTRHANGDTPVADNTRRSEHTQELPSRSDDEEAEPAR